MLHPCCTLLAQAGCRQDCGMQDNVLMAAGMAGLRRQEPRGAGGAGSSPAAKAVPAAQPPDAGSRQAATRSAGSSVRQEVVATMNTDSCWHAASCAPGSWCSACCMAVLPPAGTPTVVGVLNLHQCGSFRPVWAQQACWCWCEMHRILDARQDHPLHLGTAWQQSRQRNNVVIAVSTP